PRLLSGPGGAPPRRGRLPQRRRAADARHRPCPHGAAEAAPAGRAVAGAGAAARARDLRHHPQDQGRAGDDVPARRAERPDRAQHRRLRLHHGERPDRLRRSGRQAARQPGRARVLPGPQRGRPPQELQGREVLQAPQALGVLTVAAACLSVDDLCVNFGGLRAVDHVSFAIESGRIHGLIGPNGAGKTTIFNCVTGFYRPTSGRVRFLEHDITGFRPDQVAKLGIARTFQNVQLFASLSVLDNVLVAKHGHMRTGVLAEGLGLPFVRKQEHAVRDTAFGLLDFLGLADLHRKPAASLPLGHQKRLELARALALEPKLLLLDEPASGLNTSETQALKGVSFTVPEGSIVTLLGANGAGKSTTLKCISGLVPAARGTVSFRGQRIDGLPCETIVRRGISHVPEGRELFPELTVLENL